jgi:hypothetical protein
VGGGSWAYIAYRPARSHSAGRCCVMQWMLPPPSRISRDGTFLVVLLLEGLLFGLRVVVIVLASRGGGAGA